MRYVRECVDLPSLDTAKTFLCWLGRHLAGIELIRIDCDMIDMIAHLKQSEPRVVCTRERPKETGRNVNPATVNRVMEVLAAVLNSALDWG